MGNKITTCKPSLISNRADFKYRLDYKDTNGANWEFDLHTLSARQRGAVSASLAVVKLNSENVPEVVMENNLELVNTSTIYNALDGWNLEDDITLENIDLLPTGVRVALCKAINAHESANQTSLEPELKNS